MEYRAIKTKEIGIIYGRDAIYWMNLDRYLVQNIVVLLKVNLAPH